MPTILDLEQALLLLELEPPFGKREEQRARAAEKDRAENDPFGSRTPDHSVVHRYARCVAYPEWGVGNVTGIYFTGQEDDVQQWARVTFGVGVRTIPAGSLQF